MTVRLPLQTLEIGDPRWTAFVASNADASPFHHPSWADLLGECYRFSPFAVVALDGEAVIAGMPVLEVSGHRWRRRWVSLPFTDFCPPLIERWRSLSFVRELEELRAESDCARLEVRGQIEGDDAHSQTVGYRHVLPLSPDHERVFATFRRSRVQQPVRQAERFEARGLLQVTRAERESDLVDGFYPLHVSTRRRLGVPVQPRRFFRLLWKRLLEPGRGFALLAHSEGKIVAGAVFLFSGSAMVYKFGASERDAQRLRPNHLLIWTAIREACARGLYVFDFGRTELEGDGLRDFKLGWGTIEEPLVYSYFGAPSDRRSAGRVTAVLGPVIRRSPPLVCRTIGELFYKRAA